MTPQQLRLCSQALKMVQYKKLIYENQQVPSQGVLRTTENMY